MSLLKISRNCSCKDPRDKVYAITGLLADRSALPIPADYSATAGWVFLQAAAWHISTTKSLEILSEVNGKSNFSMPSWVPDWTRKSPMPLPSQLQRIGEVSSSSLTSQDGTILPLLTPLNYPLKCALQTSGRKMGTIWTDETLFGLNYLYLEGIMKHRRQKMNFFLYATLINKANFWSL